MQIPNLSKENQKTVTSQSPISVNNAAPRIYSVYSGTTKQINLLYCTARVGSNRFKRELNNSNFKSV